MQNKMVDQQIANYLQQLKLALAGQDAALIQDAQYDAEEHLRAALEDSVDAIKDFPQICNDYGSPQEIAEFYCEMESTVSMALKGVKKSGASIQRNKFFGILKDTDAYLAMLFMVLALPSGLIYFGWVMIVGLGSLASSLLVVGIPVFILFVSSMQLFSLFEGRLIEIFLGQRMPRRPQYQKLYSYESKWQEWKDHLSRLFKNKTNWTTLIYLVIRCPLGFIYFFGIATAALLSLAVLISPIVDPILHAINPVNTIDIDWYWFPLAIPGGFLGFVITLHLAKFAGRFQAKIARYLLIPTSGDD